MLNLEKTEHKLKMRILDFFRKTRLLQNRREVHGFPQNIWRALIHVVIDIKRYMWVWGEMRAPEFDFRSIFTVEITFMGQQFFVGITSGTFEWRPATKNTTKHVSMPIGNVPTS